MQARPGGDRQQKIRQPCLQNNATAGERRGLDSCVTGYDGIVDQTKMGPSSYRASSTSLYRSAG
jgi:hypothetical protein